MIVIGTGVNTSEMVPKGFWCVTHSKFCVCANKYGYCMCTACLEHDYFIPKKY